MASSMRMECDLEDPHGAHRWEEGNYIYRCPGIEEYHYQAENSYDYYDDYDDDDDDY